MKKSTLKIAISFLIVLMLFHLSSCNTPFIADGLENFRPRTNSMTGLTKSLVPNDFHSLYAYTKGDYHYHETDMYECALLYTTYDEDIYLQAKAYFLEHMPVNMNICDLYNGYVFTKNLELVEPHDPITVYVGYSDESKTLISVGVYSYEEYGTFEKYMSENFYFFNFEKGEIDRTLIKEYEATEKAYNSSLP